MTISAGILLSFLVAILLRLFISLQSYSGFATPPTFGDFEAHRHWMEITVNLPISSWYQPSPENDLSYWGLDYPPVSAYFAALLGSIAKQIDERWVALYSSRGFESTQLKTFMRLSVLSVDLFLFFPAFYLFIRRTPLARRQSFLLFCITAAPLILIDHGHFQYNNAMLGLSLLATIMLIDQRRPFLATVLFCLSVGFKQMAIYYFPAFFSALLGQSLRERNPRMPLQLALTGIGTMLLLFLPYWWRSTSLAPFLQVLRRIFPVQRGIFEDKVANFWCALSILHKKVHVLWGHERLLWYSMIATLATILPSILLLLCKSRVPSRRDFLLAMAYCALCFYLFSYHVHEKTILLPLLPILLLAGEEGEAEFVGWFVLQATFSLYHLMIKDRLVIVYFILLSMQMVANHVLLPTTKTRAFPVWRLIKWATVIFITVFHAVELIWTPPARYPHLFLVINVLQCAVAFLLSALYLLSAQVFPTQITIHGKQQ